MSKNIDLPSWGNSFGGRAALNNPINDIRAGAKILRGIIGNVGSPAPISAIGTLYNDRGAKRVTDYGARVEEIYKSRPWEKPPFDDPGGIAFP